MYDIAPFVKPKREDYDNGLSENSALKDLEAFRYQRNQSPMGDAVRVFLGQKCQHNYWHIIAGIAFCTSCGEKIANKT